MPAYVVLIRDEPPHDRAEMAEYNRKAAARPRDPNLTVLALYGAIDGLEGPAPDGAVILRFPTIEDARAWYDDPAYQDAARHRLAGANYRAFIVEGLRAATDAA